MLSDMEKQDQTGVHLSDEQAAEVRRRLSGKGP
jgi:hypothetical protein